MDCSLTLLDLEERLRSILETQKTTVSLDTNAYKPFCNIEINGLDLIKLKSPLINGYDILSLIAAQRSYDKETAQAVRSIQANNTAYTHLLGEIFERYDNILLPIEVKRELEVWINNADLGGYERWIEGEKNPFRSKAINEIVRIKSKNPYFGIIFRVKYEYKKALNKFLKNVPNEQVVGYNGDENLSDITRELNDVKADYKDKLIFGSSHSATSERGDRILRIVFFDGGFVRIAKAFDKRRLGKGIETNVHYGYSLVVYNQPKVLEFRFNQVYPKIQDHAA